MRYFLIFAGLFCSIVLRGAEAVVSLADTEVYELAVRIERERSDVLITRLRFHLRKVD